jgi:hypothetical protein
MRIYGVLILAAVLTLPATVWAQAGWYVTPSLGVWESFEDNIFRTSSNRESDFITRFTPGVTAGYQSEPLTLLGSFEIDSEIFAKNDELSDPANRKRGGLDFRYIPTRGLTLSMAADYTETLRPAELEEDILEIGRREVTRIRVRPTASYQFDPSTTGTVSYLFRDRDVEDGDETTTNRGELGLTRRITPRDVGLLGYRLTVFEAGDEEVISHTPTIGWNRELTQSTAGGVFAGPRFTDGDIEPEVGAFLEHQLRQGSIRLDYTHTEVLVLDQGTADFGSQDRVGVTFRYEPIRLLQLNAEPIFRRVIRDNRDDTFVYELRLGATYRLTRWMTVGAEYLFRFQDRQADEITRNIFSIGLNLTYPIRVY